MEKSIEKRTRLFKIKFTPSEYETLSRVQRKTHYSMSQFIRTILLEKAPTILDKATIRHYQEILRLTATISSNINQIARAYNALAKTKVHFSQSTLQVIRDTLHIMQLWEKYKNRVIQPPQPNDAKDT
jgi:thiamine biosynthesis lipoprotein ApbE